MGKDLHVRLRVSTVAATKLKAKATASLLRLVKISQATSVERHLTRERKMTSWLRSRAEGASSQISLCNPTFVPDHQEKQPLPQPPINLDKRSLSKENRLIAAARPFSPDWGTRSLSTSKAVDREKDVRPSAQVLRGFMDQRCLANLVNRALLTVAQDQF
jgi:hypothetical protein